MVQNTTQRSYLHRWGVITIALLVSLAVTSCAFPEEAFDGTLDGTYYINGIDRDSTEYSGTVVITATDDPNVYEMQWIITGSIQTGTGTVNGDELLIEWNAMEGFDTASQGTGTYTISPDGELTGERSVAGQPGTATEEVFPLK
jgi:hypothetical protein